MADGPARPHPHFYFPASGKPVGYTAHAGGGGGSAPPQRDRATHAQQLTQVLTQVVAAGETVLANRDPQLASGTPGFYVDFILPADQAGMVDKLERKGKFPIELVSVQPADEHHVAATVFVPESQRGYYLGKVEAYATKDNVKEKTLEDGTVVESRTPRNERLVASIETARLAVARSFYTDATELFPPPNTQAWWEVWLRKGTHSRFEAVAQLLAVTVRENVLEFAERDVVVVHATAEDLGRIIANTDTVAELRMARDAPGSSWDWRGPSSGSGLMNWRIG